MPPTLTPQAFIDKWRSVDLKERTASQSHFNDICALLGVDDPITADPKGEWFTFEKGASKITGGEGWADVWRRGCFAWEYKGKNKDLDKAFAQLQQYAIALENPPLLIVCDMERFRIHTNWTNTVQKVYEFRLEDLRDAATRDLLRAAFVNPDTLKPTKTRQKLTEEAAEKFAALALRLRARGHASEAVAHFVNRLVFCLFAEDAGLLPDKIFQQMIEANQATPHEFERDARSLFATMHTGGKLAFKRIDWFNGGLFDDDSALPLEKPDLADLLDAARLDWSEIDPSILGTLFERGLDPDKRSQLGAHYTDRDKIMLIVRPVVIDPLVAEWEAAKAEIAALLAKAASAKSPATRTRTHNEAVKLKQTFLERLKDFRVLDPACGSGNFLYLALLALKDIEHRVNLEAEAMGLPREFPRVGPEAVLGIELNPYAAELARVSVWIGEIQWMRRNGFEASRNPILRPLNTIECRDAVLNPDGTRADWPDADVVIGNPPFLGASKMLSELGEDYALSLRKAWNYLPSGLDLVCYWFASAWRMILDKRLSRAGLVSTNSIRSQTNRDVLRAITEGGRIFEAWSDEPWTVDGAAIRVSLVCFDGQERGAARLDGNPALEIFADLTAKNTDLTKSVKIHENKHICYEGMKKYGDFDILPQTARYWLSLPLNVNGLPNSIVIKRLLNARDIVQRPEERWIIDFSKYPLEEEAACFEEPFRHVTQKVKPYRQQVRVERTRVKWWLYERERPALREKILNLSRFICTPRVSKHRLFVWVDASVIPDTRLVIVARDDDTVFGVLHSRFHELWSLALGGWHGVGNDPQYTPSLGFETFPFPEGLTPNIPAADYAADPRAQKIAAAAARLNELRENWLNPADLVVRMPEVVPGYPDRLLPKDEAAAKVLKKRTLTNLYNERPAWLDNAHRALDGAVADAYGWGEDWAAGRLDEEEILARLFRLNQARAAAEAKAGKGA